VLEFCGWAGLVNSAVDCSGLICSVLCQSVSCWDVCWAGFLLVVVRYSVLGSSSPGLLFWAQMSCS
jgi:hypothetical protein